MTGYRIHLDRRAERDFRGLPASVREAFFVAFAALAQDPPSDRARVVTSAASPAALA